ncbi:DUF1987 domain-containing protein [Desulfovibrio sp. JC022]|uniref:DUF1987 domain-containing protein n=1 Tax=Desulfovibrio sp. JC022 TaxID=2593642 RepID=UPI0013CF46FE|nr:DUF1987 domain-containing protein [Desulfovibrio sp. JC022]NDV22043.1 DUF1987 domain-containing protein [Desulfovibrio sp. JC022]
MENIKIEATERSPELDLNFKMNSFRIKGESYPEDVTEFYGGVLKTLESYFEELEGQTVNFGFELIYFNSSSAKVLMSLFDMLEEAAEEGNTVNVEWVYVSDDDNMEELGEEFGEDLEAANFIMKPVE